MAAHDDARRGSSSGPGGQITPSASGGRGTPSDPGGQGISSASGGQGTPLARGRERPIHLRPSSMLLVFLGGAAGVSVREALVLAFPAAHGFPWAVLGINVTGAFLLGLLLDALARSGPDRGARRAARLGLGTGLIGGYTTYSALAADAAQLIGSGSAGAGIAYAVATLLLGGIATGLGVAAATLVRRPTAQGRDESAERVRASETGEGRS